MYGRSREDRTPSYDDDYAAWALHQARLLRTGRFDELDPENLAEEVEDLARQEKREIESRLGVLLQHLLKYMVQPENRSNSWRATILEQRARIARRLTESPSLRSYPGQVLEDEYGLARQQAALETGLPLERFPANCPFGIDDVLDLDFLPEPGREAI
ncbi:DUF29 domain-containing protein [Enterovirga sp. DB1703]|uniref:DUF29 domain-containing protein n=1 Tax=Enterovirga aerilata TaxID=2730920 RepID=A0A849I105_9HYPH|nr:DUF29 domain-containing protein [Enterovirga sp. DB1703]NNM71018.1 DUF29 domain-containing protein [Enterovirga sp. DB1703]